MKKTLEDELENLQSLCDSIWREFGRLPEFPEDEMILVETSIQSAIYKVENFDFEEYERDAKNAALEAREDERNER